MKYTVQHAYDAFTDGRRFGPWVDGDEVDLEEAEAAWVNRDSEGTLVAVKPTSTKSSSTKSAKA